MKAPYRCFTSPPIPDVLVICHKNIISLLPARIVDFGVDTIAFPLFRADFVFFSFVTATMKNATGAFKRHLSSGRNPTQQLVLRTTQYSSNSRQVKGWTANEASTRTTESSSTRTLQSFAMATGKHVSSGGMSTGQALSLLHNSMAQCRAIMVANTVRAWKTATDQGFWDLSILSAPCLRRTT